MLRHTQTMRRIDALIGSYESHSEGTLKNRVRYPSNRLQLSILGITHLALYMFDPNPNSNPPRLTWHTCDHAPAI